MMKDTRNRSSHTCLSSYYNHIYNQILNKKLPQKFVVYKAGDRTGWGNKLRGIYSTFLLALVTNRIFLIDYPLFTEIFNPPDNLDWSFNKFKGLLNRGASKLYLDPPSLPELWDILSHEDLEKAFPQDFLFYTQGNTFDFPLVGNFYYSEQLKAIFGNSQSQMNTAGQVLSFLMQHPDPFFVNKVGQQRAKYQLTNVTKNIAVQFRTFYDIGSPNLEYLGNFIEGLQNLLKQQLEDCKDGKEFRFFITTDDLSTTQKLANVLSSYGSVIFDQAPVVHTGEPSMFNRILTKFYRIGLQLARKNTYTIPELDLNVILPQRLRDRPQYSAIVDWYLLGECDLMISTMTSYAVSASARVNHCQELYKFDFNASGFFTPLADENYLL